MGGEGGVGGEGSVSAGKPSPGFHKTLLCSPTNHAGLFTKGKAEGQGMLLESTLPGNWGLK